MKPTLSLLFVLLLTVTLGALVWLGVRLAADDEEMREVRVAELMEARLRVIAAVVAGAMKQHERHMEEITGVADPSPERLREMADGERLVRQFFVLDVKGTLTFPRNDEDASEEERAFLKRTERIWKSGERFVRPSDSPGEGPRYGWRVWYWEEGMSLIFWQLRADGQVVGAELSRIALLSDIVGALPNRIEGVAPEDLHVALRDTHGHAVFGFGGYTPEQGESPEAQLSLAEPLGAFALAYFIPPGARGRLLGSSGLTGMVAGLLALGIAIVGIAAAVFRAHRREMREAMNRVTFVNQVSHELKTPLTNIRMYAELLEMSLDEADEKSRSHLGIIVAESRRLGRLIGNVLTFGRSRRNRLAVHPSPNVADDVVLRTLEQFAPSLESKGIERLVDLNAPGRVALDGDALEQILGNLLGNVEKYAASGGRVHIASEGREGITRIRVADEGPGIPKSAIKRVFEPFYRVSGAITDGVTGTGIGLAIARELARRHGGDLLLVESERGATFELILETPDA